MLSSFPPFVSFAGRAWSRKGIQVMMMNPNRKSILMQMSRESARMRIAELRLRMANRKLLSQGKKQTSGTSSTTWRFLALVPSKLTFFG